MRAVAGLLSVAGLLTIAGLRLLSVSGLLTVAGLLLVLVCRRLFFVLFAAGAGEERGDDDGDNGDVSSSKHTVLLKGAY